jgi:hypothetical protein
MSPDSDQNTAEFGFRCRLLHRSHFLFFFFWRFRDELRQRGFRNIFAGAFLGSVTTGRNRHLFSGADLRQSSIGYLEIFCNLRHELGPDQVVQFFPR